MATTAPARSTTLREIDKRLFFEHTKKSDTFRSKGHCFINFQAKMTEGQNFQLSIVRAFKTKVCNLHEKNTNTCLFEVSWLSAREAR